MATLYMNDSMPLEDMSLEEMQAAFGNESDWLEQMGRSVSKTVARTFESFRSKLRTK